MKKISTEKLIFLAFLILTSACLAALPPYIGTGDTVSLTWSALSPASGTPVVKMGSVASNGALVGVALTGTIATTTPTATRVALAGVYGLSVIASTTISDINVGDFIFTTVVSSQTCTASLSNDPTGILFGQALEYAIASTTAQTINVLIRQPGL